MKHTEPGFWGYTAGYLLVIIGFLLAVFAAMESTRNSNQIFSSVLCICIGSMTIVATHRKCKQLKQSEPPH